MRIEVTGFGQVAQGRGGVAPLQPQLAAPSQKRRATRMSGAGLVQLGQGPVELRAARLATDGEQPAIAVVEAEGAVEVLRAAHEVPQGPARQRALVEDERILLVDGRGPVQVAQGILQPPELAQQRAPPGVAAVIVRLPAQRFVEMFQGRGVAAVLDQGQPLPGADPAAARRPGGGILHGAQADGGALLVRRTAQHAAAHQRRGPGRLRARFQQAGGVGVLLELIRRVVDVVLAVIPARPFRLFEGEITQALEVRPPARRRNGTR